MRRIIEITKKDGSKHYKVERLSRLTKTWEVDTCEYNGITLEAQFGTLEEAQLHCGIHPSQLIESEKVIWSEC